MSILEYFLKSFLNDRFQRVVLNGKCSNWSSVLAGVPQSSNLGPLLFLIYINDLPEGLQFSVKLFADDTSLFSTVYDPNMSAEQLDKDLKKISDWVYEWKITFNPDLSKQAQEVIFFRKTNKINHPLLLLVQFQLIVHLIKNILWKFQKQISELESLKGFHIFFQESIL